MDSLLPLSILSRARSKFMNDPKPQRSIEDAKRIARNATRRNRTDGQVIQVSLLAERLGIAGDEDE